MSGCLMALSGHWSNNFQFLTADGLLKKTKTAMNNAFAEP